MGLGVAAGAGRSEATANLHTKIVDFRGFDSSIILILRCDIFMSIEISPEMLSQQILVGIILVGRLGAALAPLQVCPRRRAIREVRGPPVPGAGPKGSVRPCRASHPAASGLRTIRAQNTPFQDLKVFKQTGSDAEWVVMWIPAGRTLQKEGMHARAGSMSREPTMSSRTLGVCKMECNRKTDSIHHHHLEGVVYRSFCRNSGTVAVSKVTSRRWWCMEALFPCKEMARDL